MSHCSQRQRGLRSAPLWQFMQWTTRWRRQERHRFANLHTLDGTTHAHPCAGTCAHIHTPTHTHTHTHTNEHNHHTHTCTHAQTHTTVCLYELVSWCVNEYHSFMYITVYTKYLSLLLPPRRMATKRRGRRHLMTPLRVYQMQCLPPRG